MLEVWEYAMEPQTGSRPGCHLAVVRFLLRRHHHFSAVLPTRRSLRIGEPRLQIASSFIIITTKFNISTDTRHLEPCIDCSIAKSPRYVGEAKTYSQ